ncbi:hypothetical protein H2279_08145 [Campylobacter sp. B0100352/1]|uniref:hypothetical protein n=1 Tax=Campylobacter sp. B0100352/1 TaxID=2735783 RepID=UPI001E08F29C|nr:hypothetical protein [Campylobacter sp. B0100352/1]
MNNKRFTCTYIYNYKELKGLIERYCKNAKCITLYCNNFSEKRISNMAETDYELARHLQDFNLDKYLYDTLVNFAYKGVKIQVYDYSYKRFLNSDNLDNKIPNFTITHSLCDTTIILENFLKALGKTENQTISQAISEIIKKQNEGVDFLITCINENLKIPLIKKLNSLDEYQKLNDYKINQHVEMVFSELIQNIKDIYAEGYSFAYKKILEAFLNIVNIFELKSLFAKANFLLTASDIAFESWRAYQNISKWSKNKYSYIIYNAIIKLLIDDISSIFTIFENKIFYYALVIDDEILFDFSGFGTTSLPLTAYHKQDLALCLIANKDGFKDLNQTLIFQNKNEELGFFNHKKIKTKLQEQMLLDQNRLSYIESPYFNSITLAQMIKNLKNKESESFYAKNFLIITNSPTKYNAKLSKQIIEEIFGNKINYPDTIKDENQYTKLIQEPKDYNVTINYSKYKIDIADNKNDAFILSLSPFVKLSYQTYQNFKDVKDERMELFKNIWNIPIYDDFIKDPNNIDKIYNYNYLQSFFFQSNNKENFLKKQKQYFQESIAYLQNYINSIIQTKERYYNYQTGSSYLRQVDKKNFSITDVILLTLTYYVIKHFYSFVKTDYKAWWIFQDYESIQIEKEKIDILPINVFLTLDEHKPIPLCFSKQQKTKLDAGKIFCIEEFADCLEQNENSEVNDEDNEKFLLYLKENQNDNTSQDETIKYNLDQLEALIVKEKNLNLQTNDELDTLIKNIEQDRISKVSYNPQKTIVTVMDVFVDKFFPFADFLRDDNFKFVKRLSKTILSFLTYNMQKALYENIGISYLLFLMTKSDVQIKKNKMTSLKEFNQRLKKINKVALIELCYAQANKNKYEAIMLSNNSAFKNLKGFKDITNISKKEILRYKFSFTLKTIQRIVKQSFINLPQAVILDFIDQLWVTQYEKSKKEYEKLQFLKFTDKYNPPYVLMKKTTKTQEGFISYPMIINNTFISFNFTSMFVGGKLQTGGLGEKESLFTYRKDLSTQKVRTYLLNKLLAYLCLDELRSKNSFKIIEDIDFFNNYSYMHDLAVKPRLLKLKHDKEDFKNSKYANANQKNNTQTYNNKLNELDIDKQRQALYDEYQDSANNGSTENSLIPIDAYHVCMDYLEDINEGIFNINSKNNKIDPLKHRKFLRALDTIGQNNIKALYVGIEKTEIKNGDRFRNPNVDQSNTNQTINKEKPPKMIGRLATTIIMKNGLCIG